MLPENTSFKEVFLKRLARSTGHPGITTIQERFLKSNVTETQFQQF